MENPSPTSPRRTSYVFAPTSSSDFHARKASDPASPAFFSGSSFKPLHLTHPPWVNEYLRPDQKEGSCREFRLPYYVVQYAHPQGDYLIHYHKSRNLPESESKPGDATSSSPNNEQAQVEQSEIDYFSLPIAPSQCMDGTESPVSNTFESSQGPDNREQSFFDIEKQTIENRTSSESRSVPPSPNTIRRPSTDGRRLRSYRQSALPITAFQSELIGEITIAEDAFGYSLTSQDY